PEDHVANDQQTPFVADHLERQIDRTAGALFLGHKTFSRNRLHSAITDATLQPVANSNQFGWKEAVMSKVRVCCFSISLDGFGAGPDQSLENPLGVGGEALHE